MSDHKPCCKLQAVVVACSSGDVGRVFFLDLVTGSLQQSCDARSAIKAAPTCDPWWGYIWVPTHGGELHIYSPSGKWTSNECSESASTIFCQAYLYEKLSMISRNGLSLRMHVLSPRMTYARPRVLHCKAVIAE